MKLALFFTYNVSLKTWISNGMFDREVLLYQHLSQNGVDVTFVTYGDESDYEYQNLIPNIHILPLYAHRKAPSSKLGQFIHSFTLPWSLKKHWKAFDLIKTNQMFGAWLPLLARSKNKQPFLVRCGYELYESALKDQRSWLNRSTTYLLSKLTYKSGDRIVVTSHDIAEGIYKRFGIARSKTLVFPNYIDTELFKPSQSQKNQRLLCVGRLHPQKNLDLLIKACKHNNIGLDIVGDGPLKDELKALAKTSKADVRFLGSYPNKQLPKLINQYLGFVLCSTWEGCPKTLLEAMSCGSACVGSNVPGIGNLLEHNKTGLLCEPNQNDLNRCIASFLESEDLRLQLGNAARQYIEENCSLNAILKKELKLYQELCPNAG
ncbi:Uncharacterized protein SCG7109_AR_00150 [Chlamydiales bacterium SCGC AG-110-M15]|nr:Uncharacterized protein SCG7109_AR_00150 [Chlamydiales bacterium SCGC AG-110-M15]